MNSTLTNFNGARIIIKKEAGNLRDNRPLIVSEMRFELTRANAHYPLKVACLPIPPPGHTVSRLSSWCPEQDSNLHASRHTHLKRARLPIPPPGHIPPKDTDGAKNGTRTRDPNLGKVVLYQLSYFRISSFQSLFRNAFRWSSEKRDSNPRPQPWQGCALPTELFSRLRVQR